MGMRPKLIALLAVPALALVGCSAPESTPEPTATVTVTATPTASANAPTSEGVDPSLFERSLDFRWQGAQPYSEEELVEAAQDACEQLRDGALTSAVEINLPELAPENEQALSAAAQDGFCADTIQEAVSTDDLPERINPPSP
ncbi:hypothetical protein ACT17S_00595 [Glutamicibacter mysorens]